MTLDVAARGSVVLLRLGGATFCFPKVKTTVFSRSQIALDSASVPIKDLHLTPSACVRAQFRLRPALSTMRPTETLTHGSYEESRKGLGLLVAGITRALAHADLPAASFSFSKYAVPFPGKNSYM